MKIKDLKVGEYALSTSGYKDLWHVASSNSILQLFEGKIESHTLHIVGEIEISIDTTGKASQAFIDYHTKNTTTTESPPTTGNKINDLKSRIGHHESLVNSLRKELYELRMANAKLVPGKTIVKCGGSKFLVDSASFSEYTNNVTWINGFKIKKDGKPSVSRQSIGGPYVIVDD
jgi:hypothetical protein